jgi:sulfate adenylyltransferase
MIKPHGSETLNPLFVYDQQEHDELLHEAENLPSLMLNSAAAANAVMLGQGIAPPAEFSHPEVAKILMDYYESQK